MATCDRCRRSNKSDGATLSVRGAYGYDRLCEECDEYLRTPASTNDPKTR